MNSTKIVIIICFLIPINLAAQFFEGAGNQLYHLAYKQGNEKHVTFGIDVGVHDIVSAGLSFNYAIEYEVEEAFSAELHLDFHSSYILKQKYSDIIIGAHYRIATVYGAHATYQYAFNDIFGIYGRAELNAIHDSDFLKGELIQDFAKFVFELGFIYRP